MIIFAYHRISIVLYYTLTQKSSEYLLLGLFEMKKEEAIMYREIVVRVFGEEAVNRVDDLRKAGIDFTDLVYAAIMSYEVDVDEEVSLAN